MLFTTIWAKGDVEGGDLRKRQAKWLMDAERRCVERLSKSKLLKLDGVSSYDVEAPGQTPTYNIEDFQLTMPTADGSLALRQSMPGPVPAQVCKAQR